MFENHSLKEPIFDAQQALQYLKQGVVLLSLSGARTLFIGDHDKVKVGTVQASYQLNYSDFLDLYQNEQFTIFKMDGLDEESMKLKDEEYYQWKHK